MSKDSRLVYSTETGRVKTPESTDFIPETDGIVRLRRETSGRKGKGVIIISGLGLNEKALQELAKALKKHCGTGGSVKNHCIEIQGDNREKIKLFLEDRQFTVKLAGG